MDGQLLRRLCHVLCRAPASDVLLIATPYKEAPLLARASLGKESVKSPARVSPKPSPVNEQLSTEPPLPEHEFTGPKFPWSIGKVAVTAPSDGDGTGDGDDGRHAPARRGFTRLPWPIQAKLEVGAVDDPLEREADRVAEQVMRMPEPAIATNPTTPGSSSPPKDRIFTTWDGLHQGDDAHPTMSGSAVGVWRKCSCGGTCDECKAEQHEDEHSKVQRKPAAPQISAIGPSPSATGMTVPPIVHEVLRRPGQPLDRATRTYFEPRFHVDFSRVRIHTDAPAAASARAVNAQAYTVGSHIVLRSGISATETPVGRALMGHELAHVVQQGQGQPLLLDSEPVLQRHPADKPDEPLEAALARQDVLDRIAEDNQELSEQLDAAKVDIAERDVQVSPFFVQEDVEVQRTQRQITSGRSEVPARLVRLQRSLILLARASLKEADSADELRTKIVLVGWMSSLTPALLRATAEYEKLLQQQKADESDLAGTFAFLEGVRQQIELTKQFLPERAAYLAQRSQYLETQATSAARRAGVKTNTRASAGQLDLLRTVIEASPTLMPYLTQQRSQGAQPTNLRDQQRFKAHDADFQDAARRANIAAPEPGKAIGGFYDRPTDTIHLPSTAEFGDALHEAIHKYSPTVPCGRRPSTILQCRCGGFLNEGLTQYFADIVLTDQGLQKSTHHQYQQQLACARRFVNTYHLDDVARLYFLGDQGTLHEFLQSHHCFVFCAPEEVAEKAAENEAENLTTASPKVSDASPRVQRKHFGGGNLRQMQAEDTDDEREGAEVSQFPHLGSAGSTTGRAAPARVHETLRTPGEPLDTATRAFFEPRFGRDFSHVRVHSGSTAERSARDINALAFTVGNSIVFGHGRFAPETREGKSLLAHELTHMIQQTGATPSTGVLQRAPEKSAAKEKKAPFRDCTEATTLNSNPRSALIQALDLAQRFVNGAIGKLEIDPEVEPKGSSYQVALERHFLNPNKAQRMGILGNFRAIYERLKPGNVRCAANNQEQETCAQDIGGEIAAFMRDEELVLCFNFWGLSPLCKAAILIHEAAHAIGIGNGKTHPPYRGGAEYPSGSISPSKDETAAIRTSNPDAYAYFAAHVWRDIDMVCIPSIEIIEVRSTKDALPVTREKKDEEQK